MRNGTDRDSIANNAASADHGLTTPKTHRAEVTRIEELIHKMIGGDYDTLVIDSEKIADEFSKAFSGKIGSKTEDGRAVLGVLMQSFEEAIHATDWRLGYGRVRTDATIPEVAANVVISAVRLLANAFAEEGLRSYRNRDHDFLEALAELAEQANGGMAQNQGFYGKLGRQVASAVLEHKLAGPRPLLAPTQADYEDIERAAATQLVYFVQIGEGGPVKIGIAQNPNARLSNLQTAHPDKLHLRAITAGGGEQERAYHALFAEHRVRGEWFAPHPDILAEIERLSHHPDQEAS